MKQVEEQTKTFKLPRVYFGRDTLTKKWELWIVGIDDTLMGNGVIFNDIETLEEVLKIVNMIPEKYEKYYGKDKCADSTVV